MKFLSKKENQHLSDPDVQLMLRFKAGDQSALESLMRKYYPRILNFIYRFLGNRQVAEDLTQEVFLNIHKSAFKYTPRSKFQTWLYTIAKNSALNELRRKRNWRRFKNLTEEDRGKVGEKHKIWQNLSDKEKQRIKKWRRRYQNLTPEQRRRLQEKRKKWQNLSPERKR